MFRIFTLPGLLPSISYSGTFIHLKYQYFNWIRVVAFLKLTLLFTCYTIKLLTKQWN